MLFTHYAQNENEISFKPKMKMKYLSKPFLFNFRSFFQRMKINMKYNANPNPDKYVCKAFAIFIKLNDICSAANKGF